MFEECECVCVCPSLSACGSVSFENNLLYDLFWSYFLITVLPLLISMDSTHPTTTTTTTKMYNLVSGWILWYICFFWMPCSLIKPYLKTKTKYWKLCTLVWNATSCDGIERGENLLPHMLGWVVV